MVVEHLLKPLKQELLEVQVVATEQIVILKVVMVEQEIHLLLVHLKVILVETLLQVVILELVVEEQL